MFQLKLLSVQPHLQQSLHSIATVSYTHLDVYKRQSVHTAIALSIAGGAILSAIGFIFARTALEWMQTPDTVIDLAETYIKIYFIGMIPNLYYNICAAILRAVGDSKRPLYILIFSCLVNIVLDLVFVVVLRMSVQGVGIATILSQFISAVPVSYTHLR